jgi:hypothetical protein
MVLLGAFAIDRIVTALLFLLDFIPSWRRIFPDPALAADVSSRSAAEKRLKLVYFAFAIPIGVLLIRSYPKALLLTALGIPASAFADHLFTLLVLVGGADRISELLGSSAIKGSQSSEAPIRVTGTLTLEEGSGHLVGRSQ